MQIEILNTNVVANAKFNSVEVAYKNLATGKVEGKKIVSFTFPDVYNTLAGATSGQVYNVTSEKIPDKTGKEYWNWTVATLSTADRAEKVNDVGSISNTQTYSSAPKNNSETPGERAAKQVYIVKQSSLTAALKFTELNKEKPTLDNILRLAQSFTDWVFNTEPNSVISESVEVE